MAIATKSARRPSVAADRTVKPRPASTRQGAAQSDAKHAEPTPFKRLVATIAVDGRDWQTVTEWWRERPAGVWSSRDPETGQWLTSRLYDPESGESYHPSLSRD